MTVILRADGWQEPYLVQQQFLHSFRQWNYFFAGRGAGKTAAACKKAELLSILSPGIIVIITEQTSRDIRDVLAPCWKEVVTPGTYTVHGSSGDTEIRFANGSLVWFRSRQAKRINDDPPFRGPTVGWLIHDELALDRREDVLTISGMMLRQKSARFLGCDIITTPKPNWLYRNVLGLGIADPINADESNRKQVSKDGSAVAFYAKTDDNDYNRGLHGRMAGELSEADLRQELLGQWVAKDGKVWEFVEEPWPYGNMVDIPYDPNKPWILGVDLGGANSAWGLYQKENLEHGNKRLDCLVLKAEWTPSHVFPPRIIQEIKDYTSASRFNRPSAIKIGSDFSSPGPAGDSGQQMFYNAGWGQNGEVDSITGWHARKEVQDMQASYIICNSQQERRFCVSSKLDSFYKGASRGLLDVMRHDTYPDPGSKDYFRKEKGQGIYHEDSRDQFLYVAVSVYPPTYKPQENWAA
jgi:hypothetical protein